MKKQNFKISRIAFIVVGILLISNTIFVSTRSNLNLGVVLPMILGAPLLIYGIFKPRCDKFFELKAGKIIKWIFICGYIFITVTVIIASIAMINAANTSPPDGAEAIIVLGAGIKEDKPTYTLQNRLDKAIDYYNKNQDAIMIVSGGWGNQKQYSEARVMEKYLLEQGIPKNKIIKEENSKSTEQNFEFSKQILDEKLKQPYKIVYATNDFHILRAGILAKEAGMSASGLSAPTPVYIAANSFLRETLALLWSGLAMQNAG